MLMILHVFKHELRLIFREPRFWIPFVVPPIILAASQGIAVSRYGTKIMEGSEGYMMLLLGCLMAPMGAPLAADSFAGERERNSLELLQLSPVKPAVLFWGKLLAIVPFPLVFALLAESVYWAAHPQVSTVTAVAAILGAVSASLLINAFSLMMSLKVKTVRAAAHMTVFLLVPLLLLVQMFHEQYLVGLAMPIAVFAGSVVICGAAIAAGMRKFISL